MNQMNGNGSKGSMNGNFPDNNNSIPNGLNLNMLPNSILDGSETQHNVYRKNVNGKVDSHSLAPTVNGHGVLYGNLLNGNGSGILTQPGSSKPKKTVTIVENIQKNREEEEIEEANPTISLLHQQHCPRNENGSHLNSDMWLAAENKDEQIKTLLEVRERQINRSEEEVAKLQKDKRSLNHQIGLMKTEMVQMKSQHDEADKFARKFFQCI